MATATALPASISSFIRYVSGATGLRPDVVTAWYEAEGGPPANPLNIGPGRRYASPQAAAQATVTLLKTPRYAPILAAAGKGADTQLHAIAASPWDTGHYGGDGRNLIGAYTRVTGVPSLRSTTPDSGAVFPGVGKFLTGLPGGNLLFGSGPGGVQGSIANAADSGGWVKQLTDWAAHEGVLVLAYLTFSVAALAFVVLGGVRLVGGPGALRKTFTPPNLQGDLPEGF